MNLHILHVFSCFVFSHILWTTAAISSTSITILSLVCTLCNADFGLCYELLFLLAMYFCSHILYNSPLCGLSYQTRKAPKRWHAIPHSKMLSPVEWISWNESCQVPQWILVPPFCFTDPPYSHPFSSHWRSKVHKWRAISPSLWSWPEEIAHDLTVEYWFRVNTSFHFSLPHFCVILFGDKESPTIQPSSFVCFLPFSCWFGFFLHPSYFVRSFLLFSFMYGSLHTFPWFIRAPSFTLAHQPSI